MKYIFVFITAAVIASGYTLPAMAGHHGGVPAVGHEQVIPAPSEGEIGAYLAKQLLPTLPTSLYTKLGIKPSVRGFSSEDAFWRAVGERDMNLYRAVEFALENGARLLEDSHELIKSVQGKLNEIGKKALSIDVKTDKLYADVDEKFRKLASDEREEILKIENKMIEEMIEPMKEKEQISTQLDDILQKIDDIKQGKKTGNLDHLNKKLSKKTDDILQKIDDIKQGKKTGNLDHLNKKLSKKTKELQKKLLEITKINNKAKEDIDSINLKNATKRKGILDGYAKKLISAKEFDEGKSKEYQKFTEDALFFVDHIQRLDSNMEELEKIDNVIFHIMSKEMDLFARDFKRSGDTLTSDFENVKQKSLKKAAELNKETTKIVAEVVALFVSENFVNTAKSLAEKGYFYYGRKLLFMNENQWEDVHNIARKSQPHEA